MTVSVIGNCFFVVTAIQLELRGVALVHWNPEESETDLDPDDIKGECNKEQYFYKKITLTEKGSEKILPLLNVSKYKRSAPFSGLHSNSIKSYLISHQMATFSTRIPPWLLVSTNSPSNASCPQSCPRHLKANTARFDTSPSLLSRGPGSPTSSPKEPSPYSAALT